MGEGSLIVVHNQPAEKQKYFKMLPPSIKACNLVAFQYENPLRATEGDHWSGWGYEKIYFIMEVRVKDMPDPFLKLSSKCTKLYLSDVGCDQKAVYWIYVRSPVTARHIMWQLWTQLPRLSFTSGHIIKNEKKRFFAFLSNEILAARSAVGHGRCRAYSRILGSIWEMHCLGGPRVLTIYFC